jgi:hypothetical protein
LKSYNDFVGPLELINSLEKSFLFSLHAYLIRKSIITKASNWNEYLLLNDDAEFMLKTSWKYLITIRNRNPYLAEILIRIIYIQ